MVLGSEKTSFELRNRAAKRSGPARIDLRRLENKIAS